MYKTTIIVSKLTNEATFLLRLNTEVFLSIYFVVGHHGITSVSQPQQHSQTTKSPSTSQNAIATAVQAVNEKILWASQALSSCQSTGECQQLCELLKTCAETLRAFQEIQH